MNHWVPNLCKLWETGTSTQPGAHTSGSLWMWPRNLFLYLASDLDTCWSSLEIRASCLRFLGSRLTPG